MAMHMLYLMKIIIIALTRVLTFYKVFNKLQVEDEGMECYMLGYRADR